MTDLWPARTIFPDSAPRYPNVWFYVSRSLCPTFRQALALVTAELEECAGLSNDFGYFHTAEGCDAFARRRGLQPVRLDPDDRRSHDHCLHVRYYTAPFRKEPPVHVQGESYSRFAASVHYEVDRPARLHPYVDECPHCGCTGDYAAYQGAPVRTKDERVHDPLGVEVLLYGTVRGERLVAFDPVSSLSSRYHLRIEVQEPPRDEINTARVAAVWLDGRRV